MAGRRDELTDAAFDTVEALQEYAGQRGISLLDVAIAGLAARPAVCSMIAGATSRSQVEANVAAGAWQPSVDDLEELDRLTR
ncbi:MAG TPA: aldo/keto reductase [Marmoricola sp.]|nr:aldo/keto reductase [Marmoricola sp.]